MGNSNSKHWRQQRPKPFRIFQRAGLTTAKTLTPYLLAGTPFAYRRMASARVITKMALPPPPLRALPAQRRKPPRARAPSKLDFIFLGIFGAHFSMFRLIV